MNPVLSRLEGLAFLAIFGLSMIALTAWVGRGHQKNRAEFLVAGRSLGVWLAALSIAASWIWAPALFVASQKAYDQGLPGVFWFTFPNVLSLVLVGYPFDSGSHKMLWSRESIYQEANPEVTALARRGAA